MRLDVFDLLIGLRLSIVRRAADMLVLHFGEIRPHRSGQGSVGTYALHVQCSWRLDGPGGTITGRDDLWDYAGSQQRPLDWSYADGDSLQDHRLADYFDRDEGTRSWVNDSDRFAVTKTTLTRQGDVRLELSGGYVLLIFPASSRGEAWRVFATSGDAEHLIFPTLATDAAISRRKAPRTAEKWEAWLRTVDRPHGGTAVQAPPPLILSADGTRYRCGQCGTVLAIAEFGALKGFVIHCRACERDNEVSV